MSDNIRARARAQHYGPDMLAAIGRAVARLDEEISEARAMDAAEMAELLRNIRRPLWEIHDRVLIADGQD